MTAFRKVLRLAAYGAAALVIVVAGLAIWIRLAWSFPAALPPPTGPYAVGRTEFDWHDDKRQDPFMPERKRELDGMVWYPAAHPGTQPAPYLRDDWFRALNRPFPMPRLYRVRTHAWADAPLAEPRGEPWPVVILGSGFGAVPTDYTALAEELASRGYVVAAPANTYSGMTVVFPDGRVAKEDEHLPSNDALVRIWADDIRTVVAHLAELNEDTSSPFVGKLQVSRVGVIGHSFGGAAAAQFCISEPRCAAAIDMDGALAGDAPEKGIGSPFLFLVSDGTTWFWSSKENKESWAREYRDYIAADQAACGRSKICRVEIERGFRHANFTDSAALFRGPLLWIHPALGAAAPIEGMTRVRGQVIDFLNTWMRPTGNPHN